MKKFDIDKELDKVQSRSKTTFNNSKMSNMFVPLIVIACSSLALTGIAFSSKLANPTSNKQYTINIDIINGKQEKYTKVVNEGPFIDSLDSNGVLGSIRCTKGELYFDALTSTISSTYINQDTNCVISFMDDGRKELSYNNLRTVTDNTGISSYYNGDANNNYVNINGNLYRIVRINGDGTIRLILDNPISLNSYGNINYDNSSIKVLLDEWYSSNFYNNDYLVEKDFDNCIYYENDIDYSNLISLAGFKLANVGLLSIKEANLIFDENNDYLNSNKGIYLMNNNGDDKVYALKNGKVELVLPDEELEVRPVINIKGNLVGNGTKESPYQID